MKKSPAIISTILLFFLLVSATSAAEFNPNHIISESDLTDYTSMSQSAIQAWLGNKSGTLANYMTENKEGVVMSAAQAFYDVANTWKISPKFLLVLVQKEQSLVTDDSPSQRQYDWATGYAVCDGCSTDDPAIQRWKGFYKQINSAAAQFEYYLSHPQEFRYKANQTYTIDDTQVTPDNVATAALYNYTPHLHGNQNFHKLWQQWFTKHYPDGSLLRVTGNPDVWYIENSTRRPVKSMTALISRFGNQPILEVSAGDLETFPTGWPISLPNYSLVQDPQKDIYLIDGDYRRRIVSPEVFKAIGWNPQEVVEVSGQDISGYLEGQPITTDSVYPQGLVAKDTATNALYFIKDNFKQLIPTDDIRKINFANYAVVKKTSTELDKYQTKNGPIMLKDGVMVKALKDPKVYIISRGLRLWIPTEEVFNQLGYNWTNLIIVDQATIDVHQEGQTLNY